jgi:drug/metabolite transporter (DMT)-like permease
VIAILGGLGAAGAWALTTMCYSRASQSLDSGSVIALSMLVGLAVTAPLVLASGIPSELDREAVGLLALAGCCNIGGLLLAVGALRIGKVGIVAAVISTEGALAAVIAVVAGEALAPGAGLTLAVIAAGIALASTGSEELETEHASTHTTVAVLLALGAAIAFGVNLYATGKISEDLPVVWALLPARVVGVAVIALPLLATRRLRTDRDATPVVVAAGIGEVIGFACFALGARDGIAVTAVLGSQFGAVAAVAAYFLFRERLTRLQTAGIAVVAVGVAAIAWIQA